MKVLTLVMACAALSAGVYAQEAQAAPAEGAAQTADAAEPSVAAALQGMHSFNATPAADAEYYIYLQSASWCGPCVREMPEIVKAYREMKKHKVELILIGCDDTEAAAQKYLKTHGATFPGIHYTEEKLKSLPGYTPARGIPDATFVDKQGNVIRRGHGAMVKRWRQVLSIGGAAAPQAGESAGSAAP